MKQSREKLLRQRLIGAFDKVTFKSFYQLQPGRVVWTFAHIWLGIGAALVLGGWAWSAEAWWHKLLIAISVFYIGTRQNAIAVQIHEASHNLLFRSRRLNDAFCNLFGAYWVLNDVGSYRRVHWVHHTDLHQETDPDRELYELSKDGNHYRIGKQILQDLFWVTAIRRIFSYLHAKGTGTPGGGVMHLVAKLGAQVLLLSAACWGLGWWQGALFYFIFWLVPLFSIFPVIIRLRIVTEHFSPSPRFPTDEPFVSRTTCTHPLEIYLFGCDMEYHFEHHLLPTIPHSQLARLHAALVAKGFFDAQPAMLDYLSGGYLLFWGHLLGGSVPLVELQPAAKA